MAETYYSLTDIMKLCDNLIAALPPSFYSGIMAVRGGLASATAADVVARDCYDRLLAENDELRKERPVVRCKDCRKGIPDSEHATAYSCYGIWHKPDWFCAGGLRKDGDGDD